MLTVEAACKISSQILAGIPSHIASVITRSQLVIEKIEHDDLVMNCRVGKAGESGADAYPWQMLLMILLGAVAEIQADLVQRDVVLYIQMELCHNRTLSHWLDEPSREIVVDRNLQVRGGRMPRTSLISASCKDSHPHPAGVEAYSRAWAVPSRSQGEEEA
eukprot:752276-Hanusia_phi.AAC.4